MVPVPLGERLGAVRARLGVRHRAVCRATRFRGRRRRARDARVEPASRRVFAKGLSVGGRHCLPIRIVRSEVISSAFSTSTARRRARRAARGRTRARGDRSSARARDRGARANALDRARRARARRERPMGARDDDLKPNRQTASIASFFATTRATTATRATRDDAEDDGGGKRARTGERATEAIAVDEEEATRDDAGAARRDDAVDLTMEGEETIATASGGGGGGGDAARDGARASREGEGSRVKVHSFFTNFAKRREAAATAREGEGGTVRETQAEFVRVKPAPIEEALGPVHVGYVPIAYERRGRDATSTTVSFSTRVDDGERRPMTTHAFELVQLGRTARDGCDGDARWRRFTAVDVDGVGGGRVLGGRRRRGESRRRRAGRCRDGDRERARACAR